jgi:hypothetical protein
MTVQDQLAADDECGLVAWGQSNRLPYGDRDTEGFVEAPHLKLRAAGSDLSIVGIAPATAAGHGAIGTRSVVSVAEALVANEWVNGELRLVQHEYGDSVASTLRSGHAKVVSNQAAAVVAVVFDTAADTVIWPLHGRLNGSQVVFSSTGTLPGLTAGVVYWVRDAGENTFKVAASPHGAAIDLTGGSGAHTAHARAALLVEWQVSFLAAASGVTFSIGTPGTVNHGAHLLTAGSTVSFDSNTPPELTPGQTYWVTPIDANSYRVSATLGGAAIAFSGAGGTTTATPGLLASVSGYVHLHDRFNSYENVLVVTPYQPIEPGPYPAGTPVVPGVTLAADVTSYADCALALPYAYNEGIDGYGAVGTATVSGVTVTLQGGQTIENQLFRGGFIRCGNAKGRIASNTTTTVTVEAWIPAAGPGSGTHAYELHLPHWRNNPHHYTAGEGFLYPSGNSQPGGLSASSLGLIYSRPRARLVGSYVGRVLADQPASTAINGSGLAQVRTNATAQLTVSVSGGQLVIQRASTTRSATTGLIQFEDILRAGNVVELVGLGQSPTVDGSWRVASVEHTTAAAGSIIRLTPLDPSLVSVPGSVSGTVPSGATVTRRYWKPTHRFGSLIEAAWRLSNAIGRRIVVTTLGVNGASQVLAKDNNTVGYQGQIGWWDDDLAFDWTPGNPRGLAARLKRLVEFIAPRAVRASLGTTKRYRVLAIDSWQGESDAMTAAGRELAARSCRTFVEWLRNVIGAAGLSPYRGDAKVPVHWAQITTSPWEIEGIGGDTDGKVNAGIFRLAAFDGFAASIDPDGQPKMPDTIHFNGVGEARNGKAVADALLPLIDLAFRFGFGSAAVAVANEALTLLGDSPNVTDLDPPNATEQAKKAAQMLPEARKSVLQSHPWSFATKRVAPVLVDEPVSTWAYSYALPPDLLHPTAVLPPDAPDDLQVRAAPVYDSRRVVHPTQRLPASQPYRIETTTNGERVLRTNQENAVLVYTASNVDFAVWDPLARQACAYWLAYLLAGSLLKGKTGAAVAREMMQMAQFTLQRAAAQNAEYQQDVRPESGCPWLP